MCQTITVNGEIEITTPKEFKDFFGKNLIDFNEDNNENLENGCLCGYEIEETLTSLGIEFTMEDEYDYLCTTKTN